jgi:hypothetical protein
MSQDPEEWPSTVEAAELIRGLARYDAERRTGHLTLFHEYERQQMRNASRSGERPPREEILRRFVRYCSHFAYDEGAGAFIERYRSGKPVEWEPTSPEAKAYRVILQLREQLADAAAAAPQAEDIVDPVNADTLDNPATDEAKLTIEAAARLIIAGVKDGIYRTREDGARALLHRLHGNATEDSKRDMLLQRCHKLAGPSPHRH